MPESLKDRMGRIHTEKPKETPVTDAKKIAADTPDDTETKPVVTTKAKKKRKLSKRAKTIATKPPAEVPRLSVRKLYKEGAIITSDTETDETLDIAPPHPEAVLAQVGFNARMTINLGDFESVQLGVSCVLPCYVEEIDDAFIAAKKFVDIKLNTEVGAVRDYRKGKKDE